MGLLRPDSSRFSWAARRGAVLLSICGLHVAAVAGLLHVSLRPAEAPASPPPIQAVLFQAQQPQEHRPQVEVLMELPAIDIPPVLIEPRWTPPQPTAIRVSMTPEPPQQAAAATVAVFDANMPVELQTVDYLQRVEPRYPPMAKRARAQGTVFLRVIIGPDGKPVEVRVERSSGHEVLDVAARTAVLKWLFRPYKENGIARAASVIVPIEFSITGRRS